MDSIIIFGREIPLYGIFFYLGIAVAAAVGVLLCHKRKFEKAELVYSAIYSLIGAFVGAKLLFILTSLQQIMEYGIPLVNVIKGGFVFYGGLIGGFLGLWIYAKQFKVNIWDYTGIYAAVLPLGHAIGRVGCFFAGCCYGIPFEGGHIYTESVGNTPLGVPLLPIQLIESACLLLLFLAILWLSLARPQDNRITTYCYLFAYPVLRFVLEFFRGDGERGVAVLSTSQWISIALVFFGVVLVVRERKYAKE